jgi:glycosyltransferase involved in cell wall biosynthesis
MEIIYTSITDPNDIQAWSGTNWHIYNSLIQSGLHVKTISNLYSETIISYIKGAYYGRIKRQTFFKVFDTSVLRSFASQVARGLKNSNADIIFSLKWEPIAYLATNIPIVFWHDSTITAHMDLYPKNRVVCKESISNGIKAESLALSKCRLAIFSSAWAANSAIDYYRVNQEKVKVVPFGANLTCNRTLQDIKTRLKKLDFSICRLLFVGNNWEGKGGNFLIEIAKKLINIGIPTQIDVLGCRPDINHPEFVKIHGFISKNSSHGSALIDSFYSKAHFLVLPSRIDAYGIVFAEASSFGVPSLATNVGGIPTVINNGKNGQTFNIEADPGEYCKYIEELWHDRHAYEKLCLSSFTEYAERLNWATSVNKVASLLMNI